jgi:hypothetical protein
MINGKLLFIPFCHSIGTTTEMFLPKPRFVVPTKVKVISGIVGVLLFVLGVYLT